MRLASITLLVATALAASAVESFSSPLSSASASEQSQQPQAPQKVYIAPLKSVGAHIQTVANKYIVTFHNSVDNVSSQISSISSIAHVQNQAQAARIEMRKALISKQKQSAAMSSTASNVTNHIMAGEADEHAMASIQNAIDEEIDISDYKGCIGTFDQETLSKIRAMPSVASIEPDVIVSVSAPTPQQYYNPPQYQQPQYQQPQYQQPQYQQPHYTPKSEGGSNDDAQELPDGDHAEEPQQPQQPAPAPAPAPAPEPAPEQPQQPQQPAPEQPQYENSQYQQPQQPTYDDGQSQQPTYQQPTYQQPTYQPALVVQKSETPWGLTRIIRPKKITDTSKYKYDLKTSGQGVKAYIIDTGVYTQHPDFTGRAIKGKNFVTYESDDDGHGHGSHVAGTVGGNQYGVAKGVTVVAVKVMDRAGNGPTSQIIRAIDWVVRQHKADRKLPGYKGSVINMSLTSSRSEALNNAAAAAVKAGVHVVAAAGNYYQDACQYSPGTAEGVISVGATDRDDRFASFSNWGKCVDILGPGVNVKSLRPGGGTTYMSGTSMSSPHVAGVVSYLLSESPSGMTPAQMKTKLLSAAVNGAISGFPDRATPNVLVFRPDSV